MVDKTIDISMYQEKCGIGYVVVKVKSAYEPTGPSDQTLTWFA